jgi:hypothetical protein
MWPAVLSPGSVLIRVLLVCAWAACLLAPLSWPAGLEPVALLSPRASPESSPPPEDFSGLPAEIQAAKLKYPELTPLFNRIGRNVTAQRLTLEQALNERDRKLETAAAALTEAGKRLADSQTSATLSDQAVDKAAEKVIQDAVVAAIIPLQGTIDRQDLELWCYRIGLGLSLFGNVVQAVKPP